MKDLWKSGVLILLIIGVLYIIFLRECKGPEPCPPAGQILIKQSVWDSIIAIANKPPEVRIDTIWIKGDTVYIDTPIPPPNPDPQDSTINVYSDSLVKSDINVWIDLQVRGVILHRSWRYVPITKEIRRDSIIYVPKIVYVDKPVIEAKNALYANTVFGGNENAFLFGGGLDYITKKNTQIGYMYQRYGNENFHSVKLGIKLFK